MQALEYFFRLLFVAALAWGGAANVLASHLLLAVFLARTFTGQNYIVSGFSHGFYYSIKAAMDLLSIAIVVQYVLFLLLPSEQSSGNAAQKGGLVLRA